MPHPNGQLTEAELLPTQRDIEEAQSLWDAGYRQTSARFRSLARLPEGKNGTEALRDALGETPEKRVEREAREAAQKEQSDGNQFRRVYAPPSLRKEEVSVRIFKAFKTIERRERGY